MFIKTGKFKIPVESVREEKLYHEGLTRTALKVKFETPATQAQLTTLMGNDWELLDADSQTLSIQQGFNTLVSYDAVFVQMDAVNRELVTLKAEKQAFVDTYDPTMDKETLVELVGGYTKKRAELIDEPIELPQKKVGL